MFRLALYSFVVSLALSLSGPRFAVAATWDIDGAHSSVNFKVRHLMVSWVPGGFGVVGGTVEFDPGNPLALSADIRIDAASIDTGNEKRDRHLRADDFLDVEKFPSIDFKSKQARKSASGGVELVGDLSLHGVTREVVLVVDGPVKPVTSPWGGLKTGVSATAVLKRSDYGMTWTKLMESGGLVVGDEVYVVIELELNSRKAEK